MTLFTLRTTSLSLAMSPKLRASMARSMSVLGKNWAAAGPAVNTKPPLAIKK